MRNPPERILLLDVDGVLINPPEWYGLRLRNEAPEYAATFFDGPFLAATRGETDLRDHLPEFLDALGRVDTPEAFLTEWHESENHPDVALFAAIRALRRDGWRVYLATNQERHRLRHLLEVTGLSEIVDGEFASCTIGHRKPAPDYYSCVTERLGVAPDRIVFFDDSEENVHAARAAGWDAHLYADLDGFHQALAATSSVEPAPNA